MVDDELEQSIGAALRHHYDESERAGRELAATSAMLTELIDLLIARGTLAPGHRKHLDRIGEHAKRGREPKVRLRVYEDKYAVTSPDIDCEARMPLCHGRCCAFSFELSRQDLSEGKIRWELEDPYIIRHDKDGYCSHYDRDKGIGCTAYEHRPAPCRTFDCRGDVRVWIDFDQRIPAPMPEGLKPIR